jgi:hypothetical protein
LVVAVEAPAGRGERPGAPVLGAGLAAGLGLWNQGAVVAVGDDGALVGGGEAAVVGGAGGLVVVVVGFRVVVVAFSVVVVAFSVVVVAFSVVVVAFSVVVVAFSVVVVATSVVEVVAPSVVDVLAGSSVVSVVGSVEVEEASVAAVGSSTDASTKLSWNSIGSGPRLAAAEIRIPSSRLATASCRAPRLDIVSPAPFTRLRAKRTDSAPMTIRPRSG